MVLLSVVEGDDNPEKYPVMFRAADLAAVTKIDLMDAVGDFDLARATQPVRNLATAAPVLPVSARSRVGLENWIDWLIGGRADHLDGGLFVEGLEHGHVAHG